MPTIRDVARLAGVSTATVSATLSGASFVSEALQARVREAVETLGYSPHGIARSLKSGSSRLLGLIIPDVTNPFFTGLVHAVGRLARADGYAMLLCDTGFDLAREREMLALLRMQRVDGIVLCPVGGGEDYAGAFAIGRGTPIVLADSAPAGAPVDAVVIDNCAASFAATAHLIDLGHTAIATVAGPERGLPGQERARGFAAALAARGLAADPRLIVHGDFSEAGGAEAAAGLIGLDPRPTALFVANNQMLVGVMRCLHEAGLSVPADISVAAIDDFPWASAFRPALTTVRQPIDDLAANAVRLLRARMAGDRGEPQRIELAATLVVRESVGRVGEWAS
ncbi:LacI family DNA-binding transcriptional regulator [Labrys monachus]|uniref:LacI family transcriptional regulator n=1 Tax=Labrys monachus TaxID=217067 RepID=A0ABU0FMR3_9HYPH|nr:LacI family DNA-binding transcriptional regulator [Labrys monachus]MDQ0395903.1 LacI family transcriptional regulator [Labrys monachus]